ncbi:hypothetical protein C0993_006618 [Termitomyces sp. T159_Od127]|nr:hypothetical protein C0993_006618 [Termitomyces sp. T159_Od127]
MSDDNDLGGLKPTSPAVRAKSARNTKPPSRTEAGPSSKPSKGRKIVPQPTTDNSEIEELTVPSGPFDFSTVDTENYETSQKTQSRRAESTPAANGKTAKGKGKAKVPQTKSVNRKSVDEPMDVDPIEVPDETEEPEPRRQGVAKSSNRLKPTKARRKEADEIARLTEQLRRAQDQIATLSSQLEEAFNTRETEPEKLYRLQQAQFEVQLKSHTDVIKELNNQLAMKEPLMRSGNTTVLNLLTREAADEEKRAVEHEVERWKSVAEQRQREIRQRDARITELERTEKDLRAELNAEIERSKGLAAKANRVPPSTSRGGGRPAAVDDPKHAEVIRLYEDVTNLLIPGLKAIPGQYLGLDEWVFTCVYTFFDEKENDPQSAPLKSFNFNLRLCHEPDPSQDKPSEPITSKDQLLPMVYFTPQNLDMEPMDYVEKLDFLREPFSFGRHQLPLFLRTLYQRMCDALKQDDGDDDSVQEVEVL